MNVPPAPQPALQDTLAALQRQGAAQADPVTWAYLQALAQRSTGHRGPTRAWLDTRLAQGLAALQQRLAAPAAAMAPAVSAPPPSPLAGLVALLNGADAPGLPAAGPAAVRAPQAGGGLPVATAGLDQAAARPVGQAATARGGDAAPAPAAAPLQPPSPPALKSLQRDKGTWARLSAEQRLARSQAQVPAGSGPLNSQWLVQRALQRLQALSPVYLQHFVAQADALWWLEAAAAPSPVSPPVRRAEPGADGVAATSKPKRKPRPKAGDGNV
ncbi:MAG: DUF2894 domain-containing protein [Rubrivivax sp.]|jgi:hypothetical protein